VGVFCGMKKNILKEYIREILLREEIVTVTRGGDSKVYDAVFDEEDNIVSAKEARALEDIGSLLAWASTQTTASKSAIYQKLTSGVKIQQDAISPQNVAEVLTADWSDALYSWGVPAKTRTGKGEVVAKLAFKADLSKKEPDFVSSDGVRLSIKYFGDGQGSVKSGNANMQVRKLANRIADVVGSTSILEVSTYSAKSLLNDLKKLNPAERTKAIKELQAIVRETKASLLDEHNPDAILGIDQERGAYVIDRTNFEDSLSLYAFRDSGTRAEFYGPGVSKGRATMERALEIAKNSSSRLENEKVETPVE